MILDLLQIGKEILKRTIPDKAKREEAEQKLNEITASGELQLALGEQQLEKGEQSIRKGSQKLAQIDAESDDKYTSRARPTFLYLMYYLWGMAPIVALAGVFRPEETNVFIRGMNTYLHAFPDIFYITFGSCFAIYAGTRTVDKAKRMNLKKKLLGKGMEYLQQFGLAR